MLTVSTRTNATMLAPNLRSVIEFPGDQQPLLVVIVDAEAEFDWNEPFSRSGTGVSAVRHQVRAHRIFDRYAIRPTYVVDYAVSSQPDGYLPLRDLYEDGRCEIGTHLQPWHNPPFIEDLTPRNSYPGNLPVAVEREKLKRLTGMIETNFRVNPTIYKAGRYGLGPATAALLDELGYRIDASVLPGWDLRHKHGPDFSRCGARPFWFGPHGRLLELPLTAGYTGLLAGQARRLYPLATKPAVRHLHLTGILARCRLLDRVVLTPEGVKFDEQKRLTEALMARGHRVFSYTYHSPSLAPGHTPYVRSAADLDAFLGRMERYFDYFIGHLGGRAATPLEIHAQALDLQRGAQ